MRSLKKLLVQLKKRQKKLEAQARKLDKQLYELDKKIWDLEVKLVPPDKMCRNMWTPGYECALREGHSGCCQGRAPREWKVECSKCYDEFGSFACLRPAHAEYGYFKKAANA
jgi:hypothetical protein